MTDPARNVALKAQYPNIDDPVRAIAFALDHAEQFGPSRAGIDFLETWREGAWDEIEQAYPEYLEHLE